MRHNARGADCQTNPDALTTVSPPLPSPSSSTTRLAVAVARIVSPTIDLRVQLTWNFGGFLADVPRRLGTNAALDTAASSLTAAYACYAVGQRTANRESLLIYTAAGKALRICLDDPVKAHSSETLCAIMILMIVQVGRSQTSHCPGRHTFLIDL